MELKVDTQSDEGQVQDCRCEHRFRREVQRLIMAPLLGDNADPAEDAHYEVQQLDLTDGQLHINTKWAHDATFADDISPVLLSSGAAART